jgi:hypothetical protein
MTEEIYNRLLARFGNTFEKISEDINIKDSNKYMTSSQKLVINFDHFKNDFVSKMALSNVPLSCDALYMVSPNDLFLIEFKNGKIDSNLKYEIKVKIFESLLLLSEELNETIQFTRTNVTFILVYNEKINQQVPEDSGKERIKRAIWGLAHSYEAYLGIERFEKLYFKKVQAYSKTEFESQFVSKYCV